MVEVTKEDANNYCRVLTALGLEEEGDPVAAILALRASAIKADRRSIEFGDLLHQQVIAMRAAVVESERVSPAEGMRWIKNTLMGPGHLPSDEEIAMGAQALFDKEMADHEAFRAEHPAP